MKQTTQKIVRERMLAKLADIFTADGEDIGKIANGTINFPIVEGEEEGWVEIVVKLPKYTDDEGFELRKDFAAHTAEMKAKAEAKAKAAAAKKAKDAETRERKKREREKRDAQNA